MAKKTSVAQEATFVTTLCMKGQKNRLCKLSPDNIASSRLAVLVLEDDHNGDFAKLKLNLPDVVCCAFSLNLVKTKHRIIITHTHFSSMISKKYLQIWACLQKQRLI